MPSPVPPAARRAQAPTSRSIFRLLTRYLEATNREADTLRHALLAQWAEHRDVDELVEALRTLDRMDPEGDRGVEARLAVWFTLADPGDGRLVHETDPVLIGLSDGLRTRLAGAVRPSHD